MNVVCIARLEEAAALIHSLPQDLIGKADGFAENRRMTYLAGRALLQLYLQQSGLCPEGLPAMASSPEGKPCFPAYPEICFNISHSGDMLALAVGDTPQGIDIERMRLRKNQDALERRVLSEEELAWVRSEEEMRTGRFCLLWTLRECLLKLSGRGLGGLDEVHPYPEKWRIVYNAHPAGRVYSLRTAELLGSGFPGWLSVFADGHLPQLYLFEHGDLRGVAAPQACVFTLEPHA